MRTDRTSTVVPRFGFGLSAVAVLTLAILSGCAGAMPDPDPCPSAANAHLVFLVVDARGVPLAGVEVLAVAMEGDAPAVVTTDEAGVARIECVAPGAYRMSFARSGFGAHEMVAQVVSGRAPVVTVYLRRSSF